MSKNFFPGKVIVDVNSIASGVTLTTSKKLRYDDMNASTGGIARGTTIVSGADSVNVYSYSGIGVFFGFLINLDSASSSAHNYQINLLIDGEEIFNTSGLNTSDFVSATLYNYSTGGSREPVTLGMEMVGDAIYFTSAPQFPLKFESSITIKVKKTTGSNRAFNAGLSLLTKDA